VSEVNLEHIRDGVEDLKTALAVHDSRVEANVGRLVDAQERMASAVERIGDATLAIKGLTEQMRKNGDVKPTATLAIDNKTLRWMIGALLLGSVAIGGGEKAVSAMLALFG
jgi:hypothetical protein